MKIALAFLTGLLLLGCDSGTAPREEPPIPKLQVGSKLWYNSVWQWGEFEGDIDSAWAHELLTFTASASGRDFVLAFQSERDGSMHFYDTDSAGNFFFLVSTNVTGRAELGGAWIRFPVRGTSGQRVFDSTWAFGNEKVYETNYNGTGSMNVGDLKLPTKRYTVLVYENLNMTSGGEQLELVQRSYGSWRHCSIHRDKHL
jgi:hypothetical protein